ncbi:sister chromatid cohesion 1 protein 1-like isoform X2 [Tasmannia lanceolata]|uniref:sister chromatid cohesion 1 protein 1-like isoform X2 n=1 Tax=Tasmannia lanceolata TaxID=3420 RepID=UPI0040630C4D
MFYSHQLLARKTPLGQIWMAATIHAKLNRRKLLKIDLIKVCEEILNPVVPMALRLSGILMGGVVIVYERKVNLLYDDVTRLMVEINEAWKVKTECDPTVLPKGKTHAKYAAVTLPEPSATAPMELDKVLEAYINIGPDDFSHHQAASSKITLRDDFNFVQAESDLYNRFERFDIEEEEEDIKTPPQEEEEAPEDVEIQNQEGPTREQKIDECPDKAQEGNQDEQIQKPRKQRRAKSSCVVMDYEIIIPGNIYKTWLPDASDITKIRGRKKPRNPIRKMKISYLMDQPSVALNYGLVDAMGGVHYPIPLLELWRKCAQEQPTHHVPPGRTLPPQTLEPSSGSPPRVHCQEPPEFHFDDFHSGNNSQQFQSLRENMTGNLGNIQHPAVDATLLMTEGSSGHCARSIPSSVSRDDLPPVMDPDIQLTSGRSSKRSHHSSSRYPVDEEPRNIFKLRRLSKNGPTPEVSGLLEETAVTPPPKPIFEPSINEVSRTIQTHLKLHFETPGAPKVESLNRLAAGMTRILTSNDVLKVEQRLAYGDILISRGPKM